MHRLNAQAITQSRIKSILRKQTLYASLLACLTTNSLAQPTPESFMTPEFLANWGLERIGAQYAYAMGYTGKGITIGIADTAVQADHPELNGRVIYPNPLPPFPIPGYPIPSHGTHVMGLAGAARNGFGMMGVAFEANFVNVLPLAISGYPHNNYWGKELVDAGIQVMNGSFGPRAAPEKYLEIGPNQFIANPYYRVVDFQAVSPANIYFSALNAEELDEADVVMVFSAGNNYEDQPIASQIPSGTAMLPLITPTNTASGDLYRFITPESFGINPDEWQIFSSPAFDELDLSYLAGAIIAVVALDQNNQITDFSNRCGAAASWCIAAPGSDLWSSVPMSTYTNLSGTSMAAPLVAGAAAVLRQAFPYMSARQIIEVLLTNATDLGDRSIYGHGLLNLASAIKGPIQFGSDPIFPDIFAVNTQGYDSVWSNDIYGTGGFSKAGAGTLTLTGNNTYTGPTSIYEGTLRVNGSIANSNLFIDSAATLTGTGIVGNTLVRGILSPGNSVGTLTVSGDLTQATGSTLVLEVQDYDENDVINVLGQVTIEPGAQLQVVALDRLALDQRLWFMNAASVVGNYDSMATDFLFLNTDVNVLPTDAGTYSLGIELTRNSTPFARYAQSGNQTAVANAIDQQSPGQSPFDFIIVTTDPSTLPTTYQQLSGEIYANNQALLMQSAQFLGQSLLARFQDSWNPDHVPGRSASSGRVNDRTVAWFDTYGLRSRLSGSANSQGISANGSGLYIGLDHAVSDHWRIGGALGATYQQASQTDSFANSESYHLTLYSTARHNELRFSSAVTQSWHQSSISRTLPFGIDNPGQGSQASSKPSGYSTQLLADVGYALALNPNSTLEPFATLSHTWLNFDSFSESGSSAALNGNSSQLSSTSSILGVRGSLKWEEHGTQFKLYASAGWQRLWNGSTASSNLSFGSGNSFTVQASPLAQNALVMEVGVAARLTANSQFRLAYNASFGQGAQAQSLQAQLQWKF